MKKTRFAICGLSVRGIDHFVLPLIGKNSDGGTNFNQHTELVGILDIDRNRAETFLNRYGLRIPIYPADALRQMVRETRADTLIVTGPDATHCDHITTGLDAGCDVIVEKPMVINCDQVRLVWAAEKRSGRSIKVAFNLRYIPVYKQLKRMILQGKLGRIVNIEFTYNIDAQHGSSYFYRWNRDRKLSGGLNIHKCCHHFDLINWLIDDVPAEVFAFGGLNYYGSNGALRPRDPAGRPLSPADEKRQCRIFNKFHADKCSPEAAQVFSRDPFKLPYEVQYPPGEQRYIYDEAIQIEDTYNAVVRFQSGAAMSYSCNFCTPWEGTVLGINGTEGRIEITDHSRPQSDGRLDPPDGTGRITFYPLLGGMEVIEVPPVPGGHGGADFVSQNDLLGEVSTESEALNLVAGSRAGALAVAVGEAMARSIQKNQPIKISTLLE